MTRFRQRPILVDAERWYPHRTNLGVLALPGGDPGGIIHVVEDHWDTYHYVAPGDWIVRDAQGRRFPIEDSVFHLVYEEEK